MAHIGGSIFGLLLLAAVIWAIINVAQSEAGTGAKVIWIVVLLALPLIGFLAWLIFGPRAGSNSA